MQSGVTQGIRLLLPYAGGVLVVAILTGLALWILRRRIQGWLAAISPSDEALDGAARLGLLVVVPVLVLFAAVEVLATAAFVVGGRLGPLVLAGATLLTLACLIGAARVLARPGQHVRAACAAGVLVVALFAVSMAVAGHFYDIAWDANWYHHQATLAIAQGWNPVHDPTGATVRVGQWAPDLTAGEIWEFAVEHYPKGEWIRGAAVLAMTGDIEYAKVLNLVLIVLQFLTWFAVAAHFVPRRPKLAVLSGLLMAANTICVVQALSLKNDGQLGSLLTISVGLGVLTLARKGRWAVALGTCCALMMLANIKFTGLAYAVVIAGALFVAVLYREPDRYAKLVAVALVGTGLVAVLFVGYNPYVQNTLDHGVPLHPLMGAEKFDNISNQWPLNFFGTSAVERLFLSLFSRAADDVFITPEGATSRLKVPFSVHADELRPYMGFDTRVAGFGPLFGGALLPALVLLGALLWQRRWSQMVVGGGLGLLAVLVLAVLINHESWWARYAPQIWMIPVLVALIVLASESPRWQRLAAQALCLVLMVNVALVVTINFSNTVNAKREIDKALDEMGSWSTTVLLDQGTFDVTWLKLEKRGIPYRLLGPTEVSEGEGLPIPYTTATAYSE